MRNRPARLPRRHAAWSGSYEHQYCPLVGDDLSAATAFRDKRPTEAAFGQLEDAVEGDGNFEWLFELAGEFDQIGKRLQFGVAGSDPSPEHPKYDEFVPGKAGLDPSELHLGSSLLSASEIGRRGEADGPRLALQERRAEGFECGGPITLVGHIIDAGA